jgi:hypothetical protein
MLAGAIILIVAAIKGNLAKVFAPINPVTREICGFGEDPAAKYLQIDHKY